METHRKTGSKFLACYTFPALDRKHDGRKDLFEVVSPHGDGLETSDCPLETFGGLHLRRSGDRDLDLKDDVLAMGRRLPCLRSSSRGSAGNRQGRTQVPPVATNTPSEENDRLPARDTAECLGSAIDGDSGRTPNENEFRATRRYESCVAWFGFSFAGSNVRVRDREDTPILKWRPHQ